MSGDKDSPSPRVSGASSPVLDLDATELSKVQKDLLWAYYSDVRAQGRHNESLRASGTGFVLLVASALLAVINANGGVESSDLPLAITVIVLGLFSTIFSAAYVENYGRNAQRADAVRDEIDRMFFSGTTVRGLGALRSDADTTAYRSARMRFLKTVAPSTHYFWVLLPAFVLLMGFWLSWTAASA